MGISLQRMDSMKKFIYKITNTLNSKVYIGQTVNLNERFSSHKRGNDKNSPIHLAIKKYGLKILHLKF